ncbi:PP2C family protein-serine/threonine phosphatase [Streptomyces sp. NPDC015414]|uniref:PP2C family protein-serine/threonine phosphatase n=1 Tax=Streptomyces sp. NPDC015414 TaxID=3364957 RepID=UPI0036FA6119
MADRSVDSETADGVGRRTGCGSRDEVGSVELVALGEAAAAIGTTLDEDMTRVELSRTAVGLVGGTAAVLKADREIGGGYEAVIGDPAVLPDARWAASVARQAADAEDSGSVAAKFRSARPALCLPIALHGHCYGVLTCAREGEPFTAAEAKLMALLAGLAAAHIRHARQHTAVSSMVGKLQRALLAEPGRPHPNLDVAIRYLPVGHSTLIGGDWCETVRLHFGRTLLVVGDVMGHGLEAAVGMTAYRSSLRYIASTDLPPHRVLRQIDDIASKDSDSRPATCLIVQVDPNRGQVKLASAGHLPPAVIDGAGRTSLLPVPVGPPLGTGVGGYEPATHRLYASQTLVLFTDGLVEHRGEDIDQSLNRLVSIDLKGAAGLEDILDTMLVRLEAHRAEDDVAVLAARLKQHPDPDTEPTSTVL